MEEFIKKPKYIIYAEQAKQRKEQKYKAVFESSEYANFVEYRKKLQLPDIPQEQLYKRFLKSQQRKRYLLRISLKNNNTL